MSSISLLLLSKGASLRARKACSIDLALRATFLSSSNPPFSVYMYTTTKTSLYKENAIAKDHQVKIQCSVPLLKM